MVDSKNDKILISAIDIFMSKTNRLELSKNEKDLLEKSQQGNYGAFCDLLTSQNLQNDDDFNEFFAYVNSMSDDVD